MFFWLLMALGGIWLILQIRGGQIKSPFEPPPAPTRTSTSYALEGDAQFTAGSIDKAIAAYKEAVRVDPNNAEAWADLVRIQTYSSSLLTTDAERVTRLKEALQSANKATQLAPDDSTAHAVRAFALDWNADQSLFTDDVVQRNLTDADQAAIQAALWPDDAFAKQGWLYFCLGDPAKGEMIYAKTLAEHNANVAKYRPLWIEYDKTH
jgi:tetratricopeptide (TPR) repeat protein